MMHVFCLRSVRVQHVTCLERETGTLFKNAATHTQQKSEPGPAVNLYCCLPVALADSAFFPLRFRISH